MILPFYSWFLGFDSAYAYCIPCNALITLLSISWSFTFYFQLSAEITRRVWFLGVRRGRRVDVLRWGGQAFIVDEIVVRIHDLSEN